MTQSTPTRTDAAAASNVSPAGILSFVKANIRDYALLLSLLAIMVFFQIATNGILFTPLNMTNIILQNSYIVIMALGMLLIIVAGHIDLSVGFLSGFIGAIAGVLMVTNPFWPPEWKMGAVPAVAICLCVGAAIGAVQGLFVARFLIPAFIVTLAGMLIYRGLMIAMLSGRNLGPFPELLPIHLQRLCARLPRLHGAGRHQPLGDRRRCRGDCAHSLVELAGAPPGACPRHG